MRRGQAALEFLTTYGWAFLVILVMIGALAYFGILSPDKFLPDRCSFPTQIPCRDQQVVGNQVQFYISNNLGENMKNVAFSAHAVDVATAASCTASGLGTGNTLESGSSANFTCNIGTTATKGQKIKVMVNGTYTPSSGVYPKTVEAEIYTKAN